MVVAHVLGGAREPGGAAEPGEIVVGLDADAVGRVPGIVERRIDDAVADGGHPRWPGLGRLLDRQRGGGSRRQRYALIVDRVIPRHAKLVADRRAEQKLGAVERGVIGLIAVGKRLLAEQFAAERDPRAERVRVGEGEIETAGILAVRYRGLGDVAGTEEIPVADADLRQPA